MLLLSSAWSSDQAGRAQRIASLVAWFSPLRPHSKSEAAPFEIRARRRGFSGSRLRITMFQLLPSLRDYEEVLRDGQVLCRPPAKRPSGARAPDPDASSKKRASGLHVLLPQAGQAA